MDNIVVIGVDHGWSQMKTAETVFSAGVEVLFFKLNTSYLPKFIQIKIRYSLNHSDAFCIRLFKAVPFSVIMISVT